MASETKSEFDAKTWRKLIPMNSGDGHITEVWEVRTRSGDWHSFELGVKVGKALNISSLKGDSLSDTKKYSEYLRSLGERVFSGELTELSTCSCCAADASEFSLFLELNNGAYWRCGSCGHVFVRNRPTAEALAKLFREDSTLGGVYIDEKSLQVRLDEIVTPKLNWIISEWKSRSSNELLSIIDVGAGGGHFVKVCRDAGLDAVGYEICNSSREFAFNAFNIELVGEDFLTSGGQAVDAITMWGLLEYLPDPLEFLIRAKERLATDGMLIIEVPRDPSGSALAQRAHPAGVARHLDPSSHLNCFTEASLATLLLKAGFEPVSIWRFGMDAYEMVVQIGLATGVNDILSQVGDWIPQWQKGFDDASLSDDLIICAVPRG